MKLISDKDYEIVEHLLNWCEDNLVAFTDGGYEKSFKKHYPTHGQGRKFLLNVLKPKSARKSWAKDIKE